MLYTYTYDQPIDPENGTNLKFEIYGIRHAADGTEQRSAASAQTIVLKSKQITKIVHTEVKKKLPKLRKLLSMIKG